MPRFCHYIIYVCCFLLFVLNVSVGQSDDIEIKVVGKGSYGDGTPFNLALDTWGSDNNWALYDQLRALHGQWPEKWKIGVSDTNTRSIPTNNFWSGMVFQESGSWGGKNWFYPGAVEFKKTGTEIWFPNKWNDNGSSMDAGWGIKIEPEDHRKFSPNECIALDWSDWLVQTKLSDGNDEILSTFAQGMPFVWFETTFNSPTVKIYDGPYTSDGQNEITSWPYTGDAFVGYASGRRFAVFLPPNTTVNKDGNNFTFDFNGSDQFFTIAFLNDPSEFLLLKEYAYTKPVKTTVDWDYQPENAQVDVSWTVETRDLLGGTSSEVLQGFLPHHYMHTRAKPDFIALKYLTAKGTAKYAIGNSFDFSYQFNGIVPHVSAPERLTNDHPFDSTYLADKIQEATKRTAMGQDIYWGLKPLGRQTKYLAMANETNHPGTNDLKQVCRQAFDDWLTYSPGETEHCFYRYDEESNLDALVGFDPGGYSATFTDHDMCYGYLLYSAAMYAMYDQKILDDYGDMLVLITKQINNWDRLDQDYPFFRLFEPWTGHNWAGGTGGGGNNVESLSEGMQFWAGMFILGEMLGNTDMRDAAAFGYMSMSRCFDQYYRDRDGINFSDDFTADVAAMLWTSGPAYGNYVGNEANYWMNWISYSPAMNYMYSDPQAAQQQYESFMGLYGDNSANWGDDFWNNLNMYIQGFDPELAAEQRANNDDDFQNNDLNGISYYYLHTNRQLGEIDWTRYCDQPLSQVYYNGALNQYTYVCYNPTGSEIEVTASATEGGEIGVFNVPPYTLISTHLDDELSGIHITGSDIVLPNEVLSLKASGLDQYGATTELVEVVVWNVVFGSGTIDQNGAYQAGQGLDDSVVVVASSGEFQDEFVIKVGELRRPESIQIKPGFTRVPKDGVVYYQANVFDQYGFPFDGAVSWSVNDGGSIYSEMGLFESNGQLGTFTVKASIGSIAFQANVVVYESTQLINNLALNRPAQADSYRGGALPEKGNDGEEASMWQSNHVDEDGGAVLPHWWSVELDAIYDIHSLEIAWDISATSYAVHYSLDGENWSTADSITGTNWWATDELDLYAKSITAKYLRVYCYNHVGDYGYSIKEFRAYGELSTGPGELTSLLINPKTVDNLQEGQEIQFSVFGYDKDGKAVDLQGQWSTSGGGVLNQSGVYISESEGGPYDIIFTQGEVSAVATVRVVPSEVTGTDLIVDKPGEFQFTVNPNPVADKLNLSVGNFDEFLRASVIDLQGRELFEVPFTNDINVSKMSSGVYFIRLESISGLVYIKRFIKK